MRHSDILRPLGIATALTLPLLAIVVGCGPERSLPPEPAVTTAPPPVEAVPDQDPIDPAKPEPDVDPNSGSDAILPSDGSSGVVARIQTDPEQSPVEPEDPDVAPVDDPPDDPPADPSDNPTDDPADDPADDPTISQPQEDPDDQPESPWERDLGPPLVDDVDQLKKLDQDKPLWIDAKNRRVVMVGQVCLRQGGLEMFACLRETKEHESIVTVDVVASTVHAGLLAVGAKDGNPVQFHPVYQPAQGTVIDVTLAWNNAKGERQTAPAQEWILDARTDKPMVHPWVFAGSAFWVDQQTGKSHYMADRGDFICVSNFSTAMLDLPIESSQADNALVYQARTDAIPPLSTPVTLILSPKIGEPEPEEEE